MTFKLVTKDWAARTARTLTFVMFGLLPLHFFVPDAGAFSADMSLVASCVLIVVAGLSIIAHRYQPLIWSFIAMILHGLIM